MPAIQGQVSPQGLALWGSWFPNQFAERTIVPQSMVVYVPDLDAVVGGDVAYNGIHCWLAQTDREKRQGWLQALDIIASLKPKTVVAGHKDPAARDDDPLSILDATRKYIRDFDAVVAESATPQDVIDKMMQLHGDRGNPFTLWAAADGVKDQLGRRAAMST